MHTRHSFLYYATAFVTLASSVAGLSWALPARATPGFPGGQQAYVDTSVYNPGSNDNLEGATVGYVAVRPNDPAIYRTTFQPQWLTSALVPTQASDALEVCQLQFPATYAALSMDYYRWGQAHRSHVGIPQDGSWLSYYCITPPQPNDRITPRPGDRGAIAYWYGKVNQHWSTTTNGWVTDPNGTSGGNVDTLAYCRRWFPGTNSVYHLGNDRIQHWKNRYNRGDFTGVGMVYACDPNQPLEFPQNNPPQAYDQSVVTPAGTPVTVTLSGFDIDGDTLAYAIAAMPTHGTLGTVSGNQVTYTPEGGFSGVDSFTFRSSDGELESTIATVTVTVMGGQGEGNASPVAENGSLDVAEDASASATLVAADADGDSLTFSIVTLPSHGTLGIVSGNQVTYTPAPNYFGLDSFSFVAHDATSTSNVATVEVTVAPVNDAPEAFDGEATTTEDVAVAIQLGAGDVEGDALGFAVATAPTHGTLGTISGNQVTYTPNSGYFGQDSFTFLAGDGFATSSAATVQITVEEAPGGEENTPPTLDGFGLETDEDAALPFVLVGGDVDGDALIYHVLEQPAHGTLDLNPLTGDALYTPEPNFSGSDSFTVQVHDGAASSTPATVSVVVRPVNDAPVAADLHVTTTAGSPVTLAFQATDVDGDGLTFVAISSPAHGALGATSSSSTLVYTPAAGFVGEDGFALTAWDGATSSAPAYVTIVVTPAQELLPPTATPPPGTYPGGQSVVLTATSSTSIHYTVDGSEPTCTSGIVYDGSIPVASSMTIRAIACYPGGGSAVVDLPYTIDVTPPPSGGGGSGGGGGGGGGGAPLPLPGYTFTYIGGTATSTPINTFPSPQPRVLAASDRTCRTPEIEKLRQAGVKVDQALVTRLSGRILLQVESCGEAWYLDPITRKRYFLQPGSLGYIALHQFGLPVTNAVASTIPVAKVAEYPEPDTDQDGLSDKAELGLGTDPVAADTDGDGHTDGAEVLNGYSALGPGRQQYDPAFVKRMSGRIILQVHRNGEAWYIYPVNGRRYYLHNGNSAYGIMKTLGLGVSDADLAKIPVGDLDIAKVAPGDMDKVPTGGRP